MFPLLPIVLQPVLHIWWPYLIFYVYTHKFWNVSLSYFKFYAYVLKHCAYAHHSHKYLTVRNENNIDQIYRL